MSNSTKSTGFLCPWNSRSKNTGVSGHSLLQGIFLMQGSNLAFLHCRQILNHWASREAHQDYRFSSVAQSCLTLCDPMDCSMPGFLVFHQLPELAQIHLHWLSQWYYPTISSWVVPFSSCLQSFPASGSFPVSQFFASGGQRIGASTSALVLPMNVQNWFPLGWTGWISLQSKGLSRVFSNTTVQKHQFFSTQLSL